MKPPFSVIFLTTLIGIAQGLFFALFTGQLYSFFDLIPDQDSRTFYGMGSLIVLLFLGGGLIASFFHLGHPERAWRSAAQWRTSWLSREVIALPAFMGLVFVYGVVQWLGWNLPVYTFADNRVIDLSMILGAIGVFLSFTLFVCTGMIYACLRFMQEWHTPLTPMNFLLFGSASGFLAASVFASQSAPELTRFYAGWAIVLIVLAFAGRMTSLFRNKRLRPKSTMSTAIGVKHPRIVQISPGSMGGSFNSRAFSHGASDAFIRAIKPGFILFVFVLPVILLSINLSSASLLITAFVIQYLGLLAERWYFFAEANHPQNLYYKRIS